MRRHGAEVASLLHTRMLRGCWGWAGPPDPPGQRKGPAGQNGAPSKKLNNHGLDSERSGRTQQAIRAVRS